MSVLLRSSLLQTPLRSTAKHLPTQQSALQNAQFSHGVAVRRSQPSEAAKQTNKPHEKSQTGNPEMPSFSFKDLGASPTVKAVVYGSLTVIGTLETYTYSRWLYGKFWSQEDSEDVVAKPTE